MAPTPDGEAAAPRATILGSNIVFDLVDIVSDAEAGLQSATLAGGGEFLESWAGRVDIGSTRGSIGAIELANCDL